MRSAPRRRSPPPRPLPRGHRRPAASPEPENWLSYRRTYDGWGFSPLTGITPANVGQLAPVWSFSTGVIDGHEAPPIVNDGVMFVTTPRAQVLALDAATGDLLWRYSRVLPEGLVQFHPTNRGVALYGDRVYVATVDAFVVALDARDGSVVWERAVGDHREGYYVTMAPLAARGKVMVGVSGGEFGIRGYVQALDARTGEPAWKTYTIPGPGEPGHDTWPGDSWRTGGAPAWVTGDLRSRAQPHVLGHGQPGPVDGRRAPGRQPLRQLGHRARRRDSGALRGYHQYHWNDSWDWDEVSAPLLVDVTRGGRTVTALVHAGRNGYLWLLERRRRPDLVRRREALRDAERVHEHRSGDRPPRVRSCKPAGTGKQAMFCPGVSGRQELAARRLQPADRLSLHPGQREPLLELPVEDGEVSDAGPALHGRRLASSEVREGADHIGELQAWDLEQRAARCGRKNFASHNWGPVLATGGGLVFAGGTNDRYFRAFDARTGEMLWQQRTNSGVIGVPTSFAVDGVQYVAVQSGWGVDAQRVQDGLDHARHPDAGAAGRRRVGVRAPEVGPASSPRVLPSSCARRRRGTTPVKRQITWRARRPSIIVAS